MKKIVVSCSLLMLTGCTLLLLAGCSVVLPRAHDPMMFGIMVDVKITLEQASCDNKDWTSLENNVHRLKVYTELRKDPQANNVSSLEDSIKKAKASNNKTFCESLMKVNKTRADVIGEAWRGR